MKSIHYYNPHPNPIQSSKPQKYRLKTKNLKKQQPTSISAVCIGTSSHKMSANVWILPRLLMEGDPVEYWSFQIYEPIANDEGSAMKTLSGGPWARSQGVSWLKTTIHAGVPLSPPDEMSAFCCYTGRLSTESLSVIYGINLRISVEPNVNICGNNIKPSIIWSLKK